MKDLFITVIVLISFSIDWIIDSIEIYCPWLYNILLILGFLFIGYILLIWLPRRIK